MKEHGEILYAQREKRVTDVVALKKPDRVPITASFSFFPARYCGFSFADMMYDPDKIWEANLKTILDFEPDQAMNPFGSSFKGALLDILDFKQLQWPGRQLEANVPFQFVEGEYMKADEYDHFLSDMTDFMIRRYWPRMFGALKGFEKLSPLRNLISYYMGLGTFVPFTLPEVREAFEAMSKAGEEMQRIASYSRRFSEKLRQEGFPAQAGAGTQAPFDTLGDFFRGTKGLMLDMYRRPDKVIAACEKLLPMMIELAVNGAKASGVARVGIPLHKGVDGFMSLEQFKKFYWPTLRELMMALINEGLNPTPFWEGDCTSRLEIIKDLPAGKAMYAFEATDLAKAKDVLGGTISIKGGVPISLLATGTPDEVRACCRRVIDYVGRDGGFLLSPSTNIEDARVENVRAMFDFVKEYGVY
ncbi:MAG TPA: uroporphyrinogen decarboxylase family protein [Syntrophorhabdaceae bacterium]|nr:uroporphyrinogen decarboxylase family protein [Syntrophorhabdaceae bacterium]